MRISHPLPLAAGAVCLMLLVGFCGPPRARAAHLNVSCDGAGLADLQAAISANYGADKGGARWDSTDVGLGIPALYYKDMFSGSTVKGGCYFQNGADILQGYLLFDYRDADGRYH